MVKHWLYLACPLVASFIAYKGFNANQIMLKLFTWVYLLYGALFFPFGTIISALLIYQLYKKSKSAVFEV